MRKTRSGYYKSHLRHPRYVSLTACKKNIEFAAGMTATRVHRIVEKDPTCRKCAARYAERKQLTKGA